jgi:hypothetical protein
MSPTRNRDSERRSLVASLLVMTTDVTAKNRQPTARSLVASLLAMTTDVTTSEARGLAVSRGDGL